MEYTALYRKWRPGTFDEVVGQDHVVRILKNQIISGRISHAYLFCGPRGTGKTSTAKIFAKAINCVNPIDGNPCGDCQVCKIIDSQNNIDVIEIDAASNNSVNDIREIGDKVKYPPSAGKYRVYIIDEVHMLSPSAFNAFLKTLEEPPDHIVFILATTEPHKLPSTILSRCQRYDFRRIGLKVITDRLKAITDSMNIKVEEQALEVISRWSEGGMRDSISLLDQCISFCGSTITEDDVLFILGTASKEFIFSVVDNIMHGNIPLLLGQIDDLVEDGKDIAVFLNDLIDHLRNLLIVTICDDPVGLLDVSQNTLNQYRKQAIGRDQSRLIRSIELLSKVESDIKWNIKPRIMLEMAMIRICRPQDGRSLDDLLDRVKVLEEQIALGLTSDALDAGIIDSSLGGDTIAPAGVNLDPDEKPKPPVDDLKIQKVQAEGGLSSKVEVIEEKEPERTTAPNAEPKIDIEKLWPNVLKKIRNERVAMFPLIREAKFGVEGVNKNIINLVFPGHQGFYAAAIEKETNTKYIEDIVLEMTGQEYRLKCYTEDNIPIYSSGEGDPETSSVQEDDDQGKEYDIVQRAIDMFGEEYVEVIED